MDDENPESNSNIGNHSNHLGNHSNNHSNNQSDEDNHEEFILDPTDENPHIVTTPCRSKDSEDFDENPHIVTTPCRSKDSEDFDNFDVEEFFNRTDHLGPVRKRNLYEAPEFVQRLNAFEEVKVGSTVVFACKWKGCPKPSVKWYKDDEEVTDNPRYCISEEKDGLLKLSVPSARKEDEGAYKVKAENSEGVSSSTGYLSVTGDAAPSEPRSQSTAKTPRATKNLDHTVSFPPQLRTIVEQQSVEEREAEETSNLPPSPIQCYIDSFRRGQTGPLFPGCAMPPSTAPEGEGEDSDSDTSIESQSNLEELLILEDNDVNVVQEELVQPQLRSSEHLANTDKNKNLGSEKPRSELICLKETCETVKAVIGQEFDSKNLKGNQVNSKTNDQTVTPEGIPKINGAISVRSKSLSKEDSKGSEQRLAESFHKSVEENVHGNQDNQHYINNETKESDKDFSTLAGNIIKPSRTLPDIIQTVNVNSEEQDSKGTSKAYTSQHYSKANQKIDTLEVKGNADINSETVTVATNEPKAPSIIEVVACSEFVSSNMDSTAAIYSNISDKELDVIYEFPWLLLYALASVSTFLGSLFNISPLAYTLIWLLISLLSCNFFVKEIKKKS